MLSIEDKITTQQHNELRRISMGFEFRLEAIARKYGYRTPKSIKQKDFWNIKSEILNNNWLLKNTNDEQLLDGER